MKPTAASAGAVRPLTGRLAGARLLVAALWAGSLWVLGYLAAPAAFAVLPSNLAGDLVAVLLTRQAWLAFSCAALLLVLLRFATDLEPPRRRFLHLLVLAMLACALVIHVGLQPAMAGLRELAGPAGVRASPYWTQFAVMHGASQLFHLAESLLGAFLVLKSR
ncbi:DUF4149 domain-containing protein [Massilia niastensis]|uniref:DUF4149 domain-containing protein n=1 Tax=Massilia niastensis TaxID=544911 RepID=UPI00037F6305|nr:DUF4149 domain-containing protein [Massilia niastensis]